jgi:hypothetical protein
VAVKNLIDAVNCVLRTNIISVHGLFALHFLHFAVAGLTNWNRSMAAGGDEGDDRDADWSNRAEWVRWVREG